MGLWNLLRIIGMIGKMPIQISQVVVTPSKGIRSYIENARAGKMIDAERLMNDIYNDAIVLGVPIEEQPHRIVVVNNELIWKDKLQINGLGREDDCAIITVRRDGPNNQCTPEESIKGTTIHEGGHVFGLIPAVRTTNVVVTEYGKHCANECVMSAGQKRTKIFAELKKPICSSDIFCDECLTALLKRFATVPTDDQK